MAFTHRKLTCLPRTNNENDPIPISQIFFVILFLRFCSRWYCFCCCCYRGEEESEERKKGIHESCVSKKGNYFFYLSSSRILFLFPLSSYLFLSLSPSFILSDDCWKKGEQNRRFSQGKKSQEAMKRPFTLKYKHDPFRSFE